MSEERRETQTFKRREERPGAKTLKFEREESTPQTVRQRELSPRELQFALWVDNGIENL